MFFILIFDNILATKFHEFDAIILIFKKTIRWIDFIKYSQFNFFLKPELQELILI